MIKKLLLILTPALLLACGRGGGVVNPAQPLPEVNQQPLMSLWSHQLGPVQQGVANQAWSRHLSPAWQDDQLYLAERQQLLRLDLTNSMRPQQVWQQPLPGLAAGPRVEGEHLALSTDAATLELRSVADGELVWRATLSSRSDALPLLTANKVVSYNQDGTLQAFDRQQGQLLWQYQTRVPDLTLLGTANPVLAGNQVVIGTPGGRLIAVGLADGQVAWEHRIAFARGRGAMNRMVDVDAEPRVVGDSVFVSAANGELVQIDWATGRVRGTIDASSLVSPLVLADRMVVVNTDSELLAFDGQGDEIWRQSALKHRQVTAPQLWQGYIVVVDGKGGLSLLSPETGELVQTSFVASPGYRVPALVLDDQLILQSAAGRITALRLR